MFSTRQSGLSTGRRSIASWLLCVFLLLQAMPLVALSATETMAGMACCKNGKSHCCRRKPMQQKGPALQGAHPCGLPCCGMPAVQDSSSAVLPVFGSGIETALSIAPYLLPTAQEARVAAGVDPSLYQRPPPVVLIRFV